MTDLHERLAAAVTDEEAREALTAALLENWITKGPAITKRGQDLLAGDPAGWLGIGVLMMPEGSVWCLQTDFPDLNRARVTTEAGDTFSEDAKRPDTALVLAALRASEAGK